MKENYKSAYLKLNKTLKTLTNNNYKINKPLCHQSVRPLKLDITCVNDFFDNQWPCRIVPCCEKAGAATVALFE